MNPIQKIIETSDAEFEEKFHKLEPFTNKGAVIYGKDGSLTFDESGSQLGAIKSFLHARDKKILEGVRTEVELMGNPYRYEMATRRENRAFAEGCKRVCDLINQALGK